jgi:hypothetical protein
MTENERPKIDLDTLAEQAREVLLRDGYHAAMLFVETSLQTLAIQISEIAETHEERLAQMFLAGFKLSRVAEIGILQQVFFITEAWLSIVEENKPYIQPSKDPKRKEVLMITQMDVPENKIATRTLEMKRDKKGKLVQIIKRPPLEGESAESPLLTAFVIGFLGITGKMDD